MDVRISNHIPLTYAYNAGTSGRVAIPVPPSQLVYSYFKNVAGTSNPNASAYSLDKLKILDTLIERLRSAKSKPAVEKRASNLSDDRIDALIQQYGKQLHDAISSAPTPYAKPAVTPGMLVSVAA